MRIVVSFVLLFIAGCAATIAYSSKGEELYYNKCGGCHKLYSRERFTKENWQNEIEEMSKRAKLSGDEKRMIIEYLTNDSLHVTKP